jgi:hypothetical protein
MEDEFASVWDNNTASERLWRMSLLVFGITALLQDKEPRSMITHQSHMDHQDHQNNP